MEQSWRRIFGHNGETRDVIQELLPEIENALEQRLAISGQAFGFVILRLNRVQPGQFLVAAAGEVEGFGDFACDRRLLPVGG